MCLYINNKTERKKLKKKEKKKEAFVTEREFCEKVTG